MTSSCPPKSRRKLPTSHLANLHLTTRPVKDCIFIAILYSKLLQHYMRPFPTCRWRVLHIRKRSNLPCRSSRPLLASRSRYVCFCIHTLICSISTNMCLNKIIHITIFFVICSAYIPFNQIKLTTIIHIVLVNNSYAIVLCMFFKSYFDM